MKLQKQLDFKYAERILINNVAQLIPNYHVLFFLWRNRQKANKRVFGVCNLALISLMCVPLFAHLNWHCFLSLSLLCRYICCHHHCHRRRRSNVREQRQAGLQYSSGTALFLCGFGEWWGAAHYCKLQLNGDHAWHLCTASIFTNSTSCVEILTVTEAISAGCEDFDIVVSKW